MNTYRIKNAKVEAFVKSMFKDEEIYKRALNEGCEQYYENEYDSIGIDAQPNESVTGENCVAFVSRSDIEKITTYDPNLWKYDPKSWNCLALVSPPKIGEPYRVMYESRCYLGWWDGYDFEFPEGFSSKTFTKEKVIFKPWDDVE